MYDLDNPTIKQNLNKHALGGLYPICLKVLRFRYSASQKFFVKDICDKTPKKCYQCIGSSIDQNTKLQTFWPIGQITKFFEQTFLGHPVHDRQIV